MIAVWVFLGSALAVLALQTWEADKEIRQLRRRNDFQRR